jgi:hypothetical protein
LIDFERILFDKTRLWEQGIQRLAGLGYDLTLGAEDYGFCATGTLIDS